MKSDETRKRVIKLRRKIKQYKFVKQWFSHRNWRLQRRRSEKNKRNERRWRWRWWRWKKCSVGHEYVILSPSLSLPPFVFEMHSAEKWKRTPYFLGYNFLFFIFFFPRSHKFASIMHLQSYALSSKEKMCSKKLCWCCWCCCCFARLPASLLNEYMIS